MCWVLFMLIWINILKKVHTVELIHSRLSILSTSSHVENFVMEYMKN